MAYILEPNNQRSNTSVLDIKRFLLKIVSYLQKKKSYNKG